MNFAALPPPILTLMVEQAGLEGTYVLPPCDNIIGQQLCTRLQENAQQYLSQARSTLVPYNLGNYHWAMQVTMPGWTGVQNCESIASME